jgi:hypothetical protein
MGRTASGTSSAAWPTGPAASSSTRPRRSRTPSPASTGRAEPAPLHEAVGYYATYACLFHTTEGRDAIVYRGGEPPYCALFQKQRAEGGWTPARALFRQDIPPQYTHYGVEAVIDPRGTIYCAAHFFSGSAAKSAGVAAVKSADRGETWTDLRGRKLHVPVPYSRRIAVPAARTSGDPRLAGLALDPDGALWALTHPFRAGYADLHLSRWDGGAWQTVNVAPFLPAGRDCVSAAMTFDTAGRLHILAAAIESKALKRGANAFAHPSTRLFHLCSRDRGETFECNPVGPSCDGAPTWHPSISKAGLFHPVEKPVFLMTRGRNQAEAQGCRHTVETEIYAMFVEEL